MKLRYTFLLLLLILIGGVAVSRWRLSSRLTVQRMPVPIKYASNVQLSHDGSRVVYRLSCSDQGGIWIADRDGGYARLIQGETFAGHPEPCPTSGPTPTVGDSWVQAEPFDLASYRPWESYDFPYWSPDDTKLVYRAYPTVYAFPNMDQYGNCQSLKPDRLCNGSVIYDLTTGESLQLDMVSGLSFSPDSQQLAVFRECQVSYDPKKGCIGLLPESATIQLFGNHYGLNVIDLRTKRVIYADAAARVEWDHRFTGKGFRWSPDGQSLCYPTEFGNEELVSSRNLLHYRDKGKLRVVQLETPGQVIDLDGLACAWAPDSRHISYVIYLSARFYTAKSGTEYAIYPAELHLRDLTTGQDRLLFTQEVLGGHKLDHIVWSPNGMYIAFTYRPFLDDKELEGLRPGEEPNLPWKFAVLDIATGKTREIEGPSIPSSLSWMEWSLDSRKIYLDDARSSLSSRKAYYLEISVP